MHHILRVLRLEFTIPLLVWICLVACIGLDYYTTNNIVINNLTKLYNIKGACSFIQDYIFQIKPSYYYYYYLNSTTKNNNKNFQLPTRRTSTFNLQVFNIYKQTYDQHFSSTFKFNFFKNYLAHEVIIASTKDFKCT
jgi:hypothetical protein